MAALRIPENAVEQIRAWGVAVEPGRGLALVDPPLALDTPDDVAGWWEEVLREAPRGWAQFSDRNIIVDGSREARITDEGILLSAELYLPDRPDESYQLRQLDRGWVASRVSIIECEASALQTLTYLGRGPARSLTYQVAWHGQPLQRQLARLVKISVTEQ